MSRMGGAIGGQHISTCFAQWGFVFLFVRFFEWFASTDRAVTRSRHFSLAAFRPRRQNALHFDAVAISVGDFPLFQTQSHWIFARKMLFFAEQNVFPVRMPTLYFNVVSICSPCGFSYALFLSLSRARLAHTHTEQKSNRANTVYRQQVRNSQKNENHGESKIEPNKMDIWTREKKELCTAREFRCGPENSLSSSCLFVFSQALNFSFWHFDWRHFVSSFAIYFWNWHPRIHYFLFTSLFPLRFLHFECFSFLHYLLLAIQFIVKNVQINPSYHRF